MSGGDMIVSGVDLSGPRNEGDTALVRLIAARGTLVFAGSTQGLDDAALWSRLQADCATDADVVVGLDAPLSYSDKKGARAADTALARAAVAAGLSSSTVMTPLAPRMVYLTVRGLTVARGLQALAPRARVVEVHPGSAYALRGAPVADIKLWKKSPAARKRSLQWLAGLVENLPVEALAASDHLVAACGAALAAAEWARGRPRFCAPALPPHHPYDVAA
jgi:predicted nuclease with RNAse H fold